MVLTQCGCSLMSDTAAVRTASNGPKIPSSLGRSRPKVSDQSIDYSQYNLRLRKPVGSQKEFDIKSIKTREMRSKSLGLWLPVLGSAYIARASVAR